MNIGSTMKVAKTVITSKAGRQLLKGQKYSPTILFGAGVIGVVTTTVLASKATLHLEDVLEVNEMKQRMAKDMLSNQPEDYSPSDYAKDMSILKVRLVKDIGQLYAPAVILGTLSIFALTGSHVILTRRNAGLMAAYATVDKAFKEYRERVTEAYGSDVDEKFKHGFETREIAVEGKNGTEIKHIETAVGASQYARFFDQLCPSWKAQPEYNLIFLQAQLTYANDMLHARGHIFLNEVYDMLGIERTKAGAVVGWVKGKGDDFVDFGIFDGDNPRARDFVNGREGAILLDFNVAGVIYNLI